MVLGIALNAALRDRDTLALGGPRSSYTAGNLTIEEVFKCDKCGRSMDENEMKEYQEIPCGGYVNTSPYLEMRLRMLLTGTNAPTEQQWVEALRSLLKHLEENPVK